MTLISLDDCAIIYASALCVPEAQRDKFFRDCLDLLRARRQATAADTSEAIIEANRLRGRRAAA